MNEFLWLVAGLVLGYLLSWYFGKKRNLAALEAKKAEFDLRVEQMNQELKSAVEDNQGLRDQLVALGFEHNGCAAKIKAIESELGDAHASLGRLQSELDQAHKRIGELGALAANSGTADSSEDPRISELESELEQERQRRLALRKEFEKIEQQLARNGLGSIQLGGDSLALHEEQGEFLHEAKSTAPPLDEDVSDQNLIKADNSGQADDQNLDDIEAGGSAGLNETQASFTSASSQAPDDLKKIKGIGPVLERKLRNLGIQSFAQIAALTPADIEKIDEVLNFKGRIDRENWIGQARELAG